MDLFSSIINQYGYLALFVLILVENVFPPIPSEVVLTFVGFSTTISGSGMTITGSVIVATLGSYVGALILYKVGTFLNVRTINACLDDNRVKKLGFKKDELRKTLSFFYKWRDMAVLFGRCVPIVRSLISIPAGMTAMDLKKFSVYTLAGSLVWNSIMIVLGAVLGENRVIVQGYLKRYSYLVIALACFVILIKYVNSRRSKK